MRSLALLALVAAAGCSHSVMVHRPPDATADTVVTERWVAEVRTSARTGDWLLSRSYAGIADLVVVGTRGESLSHAALYDAEHDTVIESIGSGVREIPLTAFLARNHAVMVVRPHHMTAADQVAAVARARAVVGAPYDYRGLVGLDDERAFYCSELVYWASQTAARNDADERVVTPADLVRYGDIRYRTGARDDAHRRRMAAL